MSFSGTKGYITKPNPGVQINPLHPLSRGLVGYWLFNEGSGSRVYDISGKGNHGTLTNMSPNVQGSGWGGSQFGGSLNFDGDNDYVDAGDSTSLIDTIGAGSFSISTYIKTTQTTIGEIIKKYYPGFLFRATNNVTFFLYDTIDVSSAINSTKIINDGNWHHVVAVRDKIAGNINVYVDGVGTTPITDNTTDLTSTENLYFGRIYNNYHFNGSIGPTSIYNHAKSPVEINQLYHNPFCNLMQVPLRRYSVAAPPVGAIMNQFQRANIGADLYNGAIIA